MNVVIAGCGWLGCAIGAELLQRGHRVTGIRRDPAAADLLRSFGILPLIHDLTRDTDPGLPTDTDAIVACQAPAGGGIADYRAAYVTANRNLLGYAPRTVTHFVYTGSTGVFGQTDGEDVDEDTAPIASRPAAEVLIEAESLVVEASRHDRATHVVRLSGLYGPGRYGVIERVREGRLGLGPGDDAWTNWCHLDDAVTIVLAALERGRPGAIYHGSDAEPLRRRELVRWLGERMGLRAEQLRSSGSPGKRGANRRVLSIRTRRELGVRLDYPGVRDGLAAPLAAKT